MRCEHITRNAARHKANCRPHAPNAACAHPSPAFFLLLSCSSAADSPRLHLVELLLYLVELRLHLVELLLYLVELRLYLVELMLCLVELRLCLVELRLYLVELRLHLVELRLHLVELVLCLAELRKPIRGALHLCPLRSRTSPHGMVQGASRSPSFPQVLCSTCRKTRLSPGCVKAITR
ncbi:hypothetical protein [Thauera sp. SWB20]|uniref:hypothetical protein n=1 Tax=Thauera sp. SWB20 TaxID=1572758 RepID=UPI0005C1EA86|nr:hypothetical protein [Thauera sp. SWB20]